MRKPAMAQMLFAIANTHSQHSQKRITVHFRTQSSQPLFKLVLFFVGMFIGSAAFAAPQLITPQLYPGIQGQAYSASLFIGSALPLTNANATGLPAGLTVAHNGSGALAISGTPSAVGSFTVIVTATDSAAGTLYTSVSLSIIQVASNATAVSAGLNHSCAVVNGGVQCWGEDFYGQLGNSGTTQSNAPVQVTGVSSGVTAVSAGGFHSCAAVNGGVLCWGRNVNGELGNNSTTQSNVPV